ncbi:MAG: hypothetical protein QOH32_3732 [Bradyrhizobium sp.]|nr:hypothetical protein [Bradyrhizobium sp.]
MRLAVNVVAHEPETTLGRIEPDRLLSDGWSQEAVLQLQRSTQINRALSDLVAQVSPKTR